MQSGTSFFCAWKTAAGNTPAAVETGCRSIDVYCVPVVFKYAVIDWPIKVLYKVGRNQ
jgi:hypothetical protein